MAERPSTARPIRGELRKIFGVPALVLLVVLIVVIWKDASRLTDFGPSQARIAVSVQRQNAEAAQTACAPGPDEDSDDCALWMDTVRINRHFAPNSLRLAKIAMALRTFPGVLTFVSHEVSTGLGWLLLALLAALHVTRERSVSVGLSTAAVASPDT